MRTALGLDPDAITRDDDVVERDGISLSAVRLVLEGVDPAVPAAVVDGIPTR